MESKKLYVGNVSYKTDDNSLRDTFAQAGTVVSASILMDRDTNRSRGFGFVEMSTSEEAQKAIEMFNEKEIDGRKLIVNIAKPPEKRDRPMGGRGGFGGGNRY